MGNAPGRSRLAANPRTTAVIRPWHIRTARWPNGALFPNTTTMRGP